MDERIKINVLQNIYVGLWADSIKNYADNGILIKITESKRNEQLKYGKHKAAQFGITTSEEEFLKLSDLFNCADWEVSTESETQTAVTKNCKLCAYTKKLNIESPCNIACLDPMEGMIKGLFPDAKFKVVSTLYDDEECRVMVTK